ncbi:hypothetical protein KF728_18285 [Candidatus Obscuribacterales bacterium]|nr:hypothetical protein [Candidatus Obscuribacterales bacterium]
MTGLYVLIGMGLLVFVLYTFMHSQANYGSGSASGSSPRGSRRNQERADARIAESNSLLMRGKLIEAEAGFREAFQLAVGAPLLMSEACWGLSEVCKKRGDWKSALQHIDTALSFAPEWRDYKPNYESYLKRDREEIAAKLKGDSPE